MQETVLGEGRERCSHLRGVIREGVPLQTIMAG